MKKFLCILLSALTLLSCASCSSKNEVDTEPQVSQMRSICELATMKCYYHTVAKYFEKDVEGSLWWKKDRKFWVEYSGIVTLGIDTSLLKLEIDGDRVIITMPEAQVLGCKVDENSLTEESFKVNVPASDLDNAKKYTVCIRSIIKRKAYSSKTKEVVEKTYKFYPVPENGIRAYHIADAHNNIEESIKAAKTFGEIDFLILNGDVIEDSSNPRKFMNIYEICSRLTKGEKPTVFSRGNHDLRGNFAEKFADYTPTHLGNTYACLDSSWSDEINEDYIRRDKNNR